MAADNKKIAKNSLYMYIRMFFQLLIGFYTSRIILQVLGVSDYGIYNVVGGIVDLFIFLNTAMTQATQRFLSYTLGEGDRIKLQRTFSMCLNVHYIIAGVIVLLCETVGLWLLYYKLVIPPDRIQTAFWVFQLSVASCVLSITQVPYDAALYAHENFNVYAGLQILQVLLKLGCVILLQFIVGDKLLWWAIMIFILMNLIRMLNRWYDIKHFPECTYIKFWDSGMFKQVMGYSSWSLAGDMANTLANQGVNVLLNMFFGPAVNASRGIAVQIQSYVASFATNFQGASIPQIVKLYAKGERDAMIKLVIQSSKISYYLFFIIVLPVCLEMHKLTQLWLGQVPNYLVSFARLTLLTVLVQALGGTLLFVIQATGKIKRYQMSSCIFNFAIFPVSYLLFKLGLDPNAAFVTTICAKACVDSSIYYNVFKLANFPIKTYFRRVLLPDLVISFLAAIIPTAIYMNMDETITRMLIVVSSSVLISVIFIYYIGFTKHEREWVTNLIKNKISR